MTMIRPHSEAHLRRAMDRGFHPDLRSCLNATGLEALAHLGIEPIGEPFPGQPGMRSALWYSRVPNEAGELAVIASVNPVSMGIFTGAKGATKWYAGCVPPFAQSAELTEDALASYAEYAQHMTPSPSAAIMLAHILLSGSAKAATEILQYRVVE